MRPIPTQMLIHVADILTPISVDEYHKAQYSKTRVRRVCLQTASDTGKSATNTTVQRKATLFVDARLSTPRVDWFAEKAKADNVGGDMKVIWAGYQYTVADIQVLLDDHGHVHHYEMGLF